MKTQRFYLNCNEVFKTQGLLHIYATNLDNCLINCNALQAEIIKEVLHVNKKDFLHESLFTLFKNMGNLIEVSVSENEKVINNNSSMQFYNILHIENNCRIEFLTTKMPFYDSKNKIAGVLGISQYINKFSYHSATKLGLTKKEIVCLSHLMAGKSNKQIAIELNISVRTVEDHIENLREKLNCASKCQLIFKAFQNNLMDGVHHKFSSLRNIINSESEKNTDHLILRSFSDLGIKMISMGIHK